MPFRCDLATGQVGVAWGAVVEVRRGPRAVSIALRLEAVPGRWELIELLY